MNDTDLPKRSRNKWIFWVWLSVISALVYYFYNFRNYVIPTPALEGSLMVGDYLFASLRPSFYGKIDTNDFFIFHWPVGDSVYQTSQREYTVSQIEKNLEYIQYDSELKTKVRNKEIRIKSIDERLHYIKRCVAGPGDSLQIIDKQIYLNGKPVKNPKHIQYLYQVQLPPNVNVNIKKLDEWGIDYGDSAYGGKDVFRNGQGILFIDDEQVSKLKSLDPNVMVIPYPQQAEPLKLFPFDTIVGSQNWSVDNYGPIWIPKAGATTPLTLQNLPFYRRVIEVYENNKLEVKGQDIIINGQKATSYTFKQDYYWAMGDNRHNSEDSRAWGYVPHDHIVGKPLFIWFSTKEGNIRNGINWDRIFTSATKE